MIGPRRDLNEKNGKTHSPPDVDMEDGMEELSDSIVLDEPLGRKGLVKGHPHSEASAPPGGATAPIAPQSHPPLPRPNPPPRPDPAAMPTERRPPFKADGDDAPENLPTVALPQLVPRYESQTGDASPAGSPEVPPPEPRFAPVGLSSDGEVTTLPRGTRLPVLAAALKAGLRKASRLVPSRASRRDRLGHELPPRRRVGSFSIIALVAAGAGVVAIRVGRSHERTARSPAPPVSAEAPVASAPSLSPLPVPEAATPANTACIRARESRIIAPNATVTAGIEVRAFGDDIAVGFAPNDHQAMMVRLDPSSLAAVESSVAASPHPIRRVTPIAVPGGRLGVAIDVDRKGDPLGGRRTLPLDPPLQVGVANAHVAWAPWNRSVAGSLWPLEHVETVEALRGARSEPNPSTVAITFRSSGAVWIGAAEGSGALAAKGDLFRIEGLGPVLGSPAIALNEGVGLLAWADRPSSDELWRLRWVRFKVGEAPGAPSTFEPPPGGNGEQAMSPGLTVIPGGRFLLTWTQGPISVHEVRALTLSAEGAPVGAPLTVSTPGANAGQGQAAVTPGGRGLVAFLEAGANGFQVAVAPIVCRQ